MTSRLCTYLDNLDFATFIKKSLHDSTKTLDDRYISKLPFFESTSVSLET
jgi:hypothetical protein